MFDNRVTRLLGVEVPIVQAVRLVAQRLRLIAARRGERADLLLRRSVEMQAPRVALEHALEAVTEAALPAVPAVFSGARVCGNRRARRERETRDREAKRVCELHRSVPLVHPGRGTRAEFDPSGTGPVYCGRLAPIGLGRGVRPSARSAPRERSCLSHTGF